MKSITDFASDAEYYEYLRMYFSGMAMQGLLSGQNAKDISTIAVQHADNLILELKQKK